jgi:hypothetical protein
MILLGEESARVRRWLSDATLVLEPLRLLAYTEPYEALLTNTQEVASPRRVKNGALP